MTQKGGKMGPPKIPPEDYKEHKREASSQYRGKLNQLQITVEQLETAVKRHEDTLQKLQQGHGNSKDLDPMLRYRISLLERILFEKGIDVQAELSGPQQISTPRLQPTQKTFGDCHLLGRRSTGEVTPHIQREASYVSHQPLPNVMTPSTGDGLAQPSSSLPNYPPTCSIDPEPYPEEHTQQLSQGIGFSQGNLFQEPTLPQLGSDNGSTWIPFNEPYEAPKGISNGPFGLQQSMTTSTQLSHQQLCTQW